MDRYDILAIIDEEINDRISTQSISDTPEEYNDEIDGLNRLKVCIDEQTTLSSS